MCPQLDQQNLPWQFLKIGASRREGESFYFLALDLRRCKETEWLWPQPLEATQQRCEEEGTKKGGERPLMVLEPWLAQLPSSCSLVSTTDIFFLFGWFGF
jgi:hypothetical protein